MARLLRYGQVVLAGEVLEEVDEDEVEALLAVLEEFRLLRRIGGHGLIEAPMKDGLLMEVRTTRRKRLRSTVEA